MELMHPLRKALLLAIVMGDSVLSSIATLLVGASQGLSSSMTQETKEAKRVLLMTVNQSC